MPSIPHKLCHTCGQIKSPDEFHRSKRSSDGHVDRCKDCVRAYYKVYYAVNQDKKIAQTSRYHQEHPEVARKAQATYKAKNRERLLPQVRANSAAWRAKNRDKDRATSLRWYYNNRARRKANTLRWQRANRDKTRASIHRYYARRRDNGGSYTAQEWQQVKQQYDYHCLCCHRREPDITLTVDHVVPIEWGGSNDISNIQPLCKSCNSSKSNRHATDYRLRWVPIGMAQTRLDL